MTIDKDLLDILACPDTHAPLVEVKDGDEHWLVSTDAATRKRYPVRGNLPILLKDEAEVMDEDAWKAVMAASGKG